MNWELGIKRVYFFLWAIWIVFLVLVPRVDSADVGRLILGGIIFGVLIPAVLYFVAIRIASGFRSGPDKRE